MLRYVHMLIAHWWIAPLCAANAEYRQTIWTTITLLNFIVHISKKNDYEYLVKEKRNLKNIWVPFSSCLRLEIFNKKPIRYLVPQRLIIDIANVSYTLIISLPFPVLIRCAALVLVSHLLVKFSSFPLQALLDLPSLMKMKSAPPAWEQRAVGININASLCSTNRLRYTHIHSYMSVLISRYIALKHDSASEWPKTDCIGPTLFAFYAHIYANLIGVNLWFVAMHANFYIYGYKYYICMDISGCILVYSILVGSHECVECVDNAAATGGPFIKFELTIASISCIIYTHTKTHTHTHTVCHRLAVVRFVAVIRPIELAAFRFSTVNRNKS